MAARINVRVLLILIIILGLLGGGIGGIWLFSEKSAEDHYVRAAELTDAGSLSFAHRELEAAIRKDPDMRAAIDLMHRVHGRIVPGSRDEALEYLQWTLRLANHAAAIFQDDPEAQRSTIRAFRAMTPFLPASLARAWWDEMRRAGERLATIGAAADEWAEPEGRLAEALWLSTPNAGIDLRTDRTDAQREEGIAILRTLVEERPDWDDARAALLAALSAEVRILATEGVPAGEMDKAVAVLRQAVEQAEAEMPADAVEGDVPIRTWLQAAVARRTVHRARFERLRQEQALGGDVAGARAAFDEAAAAADRTLGIARDVAVRYATTAMVPTPEEIVDAARASEAAAAPAVNGTGTGPVYDGPRPEALKAAREEFVQIIASAIEPLLPLATQDARFSVAPILDAALARDGMGDSVRLRLTDVRARTYEVRRVDGDEEDQAALLDRLDAAVAALSAVPAPAMGIDAHLLRTARIEARVAAVEAIIFRADRLSRTDDGYAELRAGAGAAAEAVDEVIEGLGRSPEEDALARYARAMAAFVRDDARTASAELEALREDDQDERLRADRRANVNRVLAWALRQEGALARAAQVLEESLDGVDEQLAVLAELARVRLRLNELDATREIVDRIERAFPRQTQLVASLREEIARRAGRAEDPVARELADVQALLEVGRLQQARTRMDRLAGSEEGRDDVRVQGAAGRVAQLMGDRDAALAAYRRALELAPDNERIAAQVAALEQEDPVERVVTMAGASTDDPVERAVIVVLSLERQRLDAERNAARAEDPQVASDFAALAASLAAGIEQWTAEVETGIDAASAAVRERWFASRLDRAIREQDWAAAEQVVGVIAAEDVDATDGSLSAGRLAVARAEASEGQERAAFLQEAVEALTEARDRLPFSAEVARLLAGTHRLRGDLESAREAYDLAWRNDPVSPPLAREYAEVLVATGRLDRAVAVVGETAARNPGNVRLREIRLGLEARRGNDGLVLLERRRIHRQTPDDLANAQRYALLLIETTPTYPLLVDEAGQPLVSPGEWARMSAEAQLERLRAERRRWLAEADEIIRSLAADPERGDSDAMQLTVSVLRALHDAASGRPEEMGSEIRSMISGASDPQLRQIAVAIGTALLVDTQRVPEAIEILREERGRLGAADEAAQWLWYEYESFRRAGRPQLAVPALEELRDRLGGATTPILVPRIADLDVDQRLLSAAEVERTLIEALLAGGRVAEARAQWDSAANEDDRRWLLLDASILAREADAAWLTGDESEAEAIGARFDARVDELLAARPDDVAAWRLRIRRLVERSQREGRADLLADAERALDDAATVIENPAALFPSRVLLLETSGDDAGLVGLFAERLDEQPDNDALRGRLFELYVGLGRLDEAERTAREAVERYGPSGSSMSWRRRLGDLLARRGDHAGAAGVFAEAYALSGDDLGLLRSQAAQMLLTEPPSVRRVADMLAGRESEMQEAPGLRSVYARALDGLGRPVPADREFERALADLRTLVAGGQLADRNLEVWVDQVRRATGEDMEQTEARVRRLAGDELEPWVLAGLGRGWLVAGAPGRATERFEAALEATGDAPELRGQRVELARLLAQSRLAEGRPDDALAAFELALAERPDDPRLLNNVAFLLATEVGDPDRAYPLAMAAVARRPRDWAVLDTAGKICAMLERWEEAESYLRQSIVADERGLNTFHLAEVLAATDRDREAMRLLERASELAPDDDDLRTRIDALANELAGVGG